MMRRRGRVVRRRRVELVIGCFADKVNAERDESNAEAWSRVPELVRQHRMLSPLVSPPEKLSRRSKRLSHSLSQSLCFVSALPLVTYCCFMDLRQLCLKPSPDTSYAVRSMELWPEFELDLELDVACLVSFSFLVFRF